MEFLDIRIVTDENINHDLGNSNVIICTKLFKWGSSIIGYRSYPIENPFAHYPHSVIMNNGRLNTCILNYHTKESLNFPELIHVPCLPFSGAISGFFKLGKLTFPPNELCKEYGNDWYIPSILELYDFFKIKKFRNQIFDLLGIAGPILIWSSTPYLEIEQNWRIPYSFSINKAKALLVQYDSTIMAQTIAVDNEAYVLLFKKGHAK